ncbi:hypothetical protein H1C71_011998 [Ictidomys tridecemlineatus]|uniref:Palmitoyltransferase n=1 Tax=Ictidomys tridecemlineatus TaxID=43179 RepID=I3NEU5_ICTTR|nr:palmitoyltransferase ZDHHC3-like [Ictidomys tridecemlineatus]KAG3290698.1 hypothetical protein H1C71_011997 [Ictidomys tridecemlineatus]KAG3290699.1 hypothetical protein H1C71_011998 [Ictidomys tridecemlineatus]
MAPAPVPVPHTLERKPQLGPLRALQPMHPRLGPWCPRLGPSRRPWFVCDILGIVFAVSTWVLTFGTAWVTTRELFLPARDLAYSLANGLLLHLQAALGLAAHARAMLTDPGAVPLGRAPGSAPDARCLWCCSAKPPRAHHCCVCGRCVRKMDHHCTWVNNCVGEDNQKYFVLFTLYMGLASLHLLLLLGVPVLRSHARGEWDRHSTVSPRRSLMYLFLVALIAFLLNSTMFAMQMYSICTDRTLIERLQRDRWLPRKGSPWSSLKAVFGHRVSLAWLSPFASPEPPRVHEHHWMV